MKQHTTRGKRSMAGALSPVYLAGLVAAVLLLPGTCLADGFADLTGGVVASGLAVNTAATFGGHVGYLGKLFGVEGDYGYSRDVGPASSSPPGLAITKVNVRTIMADFLVGPTAADGKIHPFAAVGFGVIGAVAKSGDIFSLSIGTAGNDLALGVGGGVLAKVSNRIGIRVDGRYIRDLREAHEVPGAKAGMVRASAGVALWF